MLEANKRHDYFNTLNIKGIFIWNFLDKSSYITNCLNIILRNQTYIYTRLRNIVFKW